MSLHLSRVPVIGVIILMCLAKEPMDPLLAMVACKAGFVLPCPRPSGSVTSLVPQVCQHVTLLLRVVLCSSN